MNLIHSKNIKANPPKWLGSNLFLYININNYFILFLNIKNYSCTFQALTSNIPYPPQFSYGYHRMENHDTHTLNIPFLL